MKLIFALPLFVAAATADFLDLGDFRPRHIEPRISRIPLTDLDQRITNGQVASVGQFPYQGGLLANLPDGLFFCGCSIISDEWLLTAAHCTYGAINVSVILGEINLNEIDYSANPLIPVDGSEIIVHEGYDSVNLINDISLIKLPAPVTISATIQPINLPKKRQINPNYVGVIAVASGWGKDSDDATTVSPVLRYVYSVVISNLICSLSYLTPIEDSQICTSGIGGRSTCNGDSGGPLAYNYNSKNILIGITSFVSSQGCEKGYPDGFTRVTEFLDWIEDNSGIVSTYE